MIFNYQFHEAMHEDENTDLFDAVLGDITQFFELPLRWDAVLQIRQCPADAVFAAVQISLKAQCWSCFSGLVVGRSEPVLFRFNQQNQLCDRTHS